MKMQKKSDDNKDKIFKILIVDDDEDILDALQLTLSNVWEFNSEISTTTNGETALAEMVENKYDLILADYNIQGMNGIELLTEVHEKYPKTGRILLTDFSELEKAKAATDTQKVDNYIEKPLYYDELKTKICGALMKKTGPEVIGPINIDKSEEGLEILKAALEQQPRTYTAQNQLPTIIIIFNSRDEYKRFLNQIKFMGNVYIEAQQVLKDKYIVTVGLFLNAFDKQI